MSGMRFTPKGYGGHRRDADRVKRDGWQDSRCWRSHSMITG